MWTWSRLGQLAQWPSISLNPRPPYPHDTLHFDSTKYRKGPQGKSAVSEHVNIALQTMFGSTRSALKFTNRSFRYAAHTCLLNELPTELREPRQILSPSLSPPITHGSPSSSPSSLSPLPSSLTHSVFHSELKTWLFGKSFPPSTFSSPTGLILRTL